ncbi:MAG TPA: alpha/beta fold hydrolase, partial [Thermomicrobiales bacterium]|nr:alpha/beta fold hydrolase [Thermomicrobiales bacterium]
QRIGKGDASAWHREWVATADRIAAIGDSCAAAGRRVSAQEAYFRASNYYRVSYYPLYGTPVDPRLVAAFDAETTAFLNGAALSDFPIEAVEIPFEGATLPGYLVTVDDSGQPRPTIVHTNGYDSDIQEMYFAHAPAAIRRGYNVLLYDGPGQGRNLIKDGMHLRPDWETVVRPVIDYALTRPEIDPAKIALSGWSLGGFLAPRGAAFEHRIAALIADPGLWDMRDAVVRQLPLTDAQKAAFPNIDPALLDPMEVWLKSPEAPPMLHWSLIQRGFWVNGVDSVFALFVDLSRYELSPVAKNIACPTFISQAEDDPLAAFAPQLYAAITQPKVLVPFTAAEGAGMHCEAMARTLYDQRMFDWLDETLGVGA